MTFIYIKNWKKYLKFTPLEIMILIKTKNWFGRILSWPRLYWGMGPFLWKTWLSKRTYSLNRVMDQFHVLLLFAMMTLQFHWNFNIGWSKMLGLMMYLRSKTQIICLCFASHKNYVILSIRYLLNTHEVMNWTLSLCVQIIGNRMLAIHSLVPNLYEIYIIWCDLWILPNNKW